MELFDYIVIATNPLQAVTLYLVYYATYQESKYGRKVEALAYIGYAVLISTTVAFLDQPIILMAINIACLFAVSLIYEGKLLMKLIRVLILYGMAITIEVIVAYLTGVIGRTPIARTTYNSIVGTIAVKIVFLIVAFIYYTYKNHKREEREIPMRYYIAIVLILLGSIFHFIAILNADGIAIETVIFCAGIVLVMNIFTVEIMENLFLWYLTKSEHDVRQEKTQAIESQHEIIMRANESNYALYYALQHGEKSHVGALIELNKKGNIEGIRDYINGLEQEREGAQPPYESGNYMFDNVINSKIKEIREASISLTTQVNVPNDISILSYDVITIIGNLLDNAITALKEEEDRNLRIYANCRAGELIIYVKNNFTKRLQKVDGRIVSSKVSEKICGHGLKQISDILKAYKGSMDIQWDVDCFSVCVIIPYNDICLAENKEVESNGYWFF